MVFFDEGFSSGEGRVCDKFCGCGVECDCDCVQFFEGDVSVEEVLYRLLGNSEFVGELELCHSFCFKDEQYVFLDSDFIHDFFFLFWSWCKGKKMF